MSDKFFIDTNIFVYCFDDLQPEKKAMSLSIIIDALKTGNGIISWQIIQEFLNVSTRKFLVPLKPDDAKIYLQKVLNPLCEVFPDLDLYQKAIDIQNNTGYSFYDSLVIAGALRGECNILYSEDLKNGHQVDGLKVVNPFVSKSLLH
jgi:predicted nucleic acid-binding protein